MIQLLSFLLLPFLSLFFTDQMCECYTAVSEWQELEGWYSHVHTLQGQANGGPETSAAFSIHYDINQLRYGGMAVWQYARISLIINL